jgi:hypothetical protein
MSRAGNSSPMTKRRSAARTLGLVVIGILMLGAGAWSVLASNYWDHAPGWLRAVLAAACGSATLIACGALASQRWRWLAVALFLGLFALLLLCWCSIKPSNARDWAPENAKLAYATIDGDNITLHNIRNFDYRSETDFTPAYYDRTFDLRQLNAVDVFTVYWMGPAIAHVFVSFGFTDGKHVAISIEARKERTQQYSSIAGFFRQYQLYYLVADERDVVRVRSNYRRDPPEQVYLYRVLASPDSIRQVFLEYLHKLNGLRERPEWYNSLTDNCTSNIWLNARVNPRALPYSWKVLLSGYVPQYLYEHGILDNSIPFAELQQRAAINALAQAADRAPDFSQRIRAGYTAASQPAAAPQPQR